MEDIAFSRLLPYCKMQYPQFEIAKHHKLIAHHLQRAENGEVSRLAIFMPPRSGKTFLSANFFSAWYLGRNPTHQVIYASYNEGRASDIGRDVRNLMAAPVHQTVFPNGKLAKDAKASRRFSTDAGGNFFAVGSGGSLTGRGAHLAILDDLIKDSVDASSEVSRRRLEEWFTSVLYTRLMPGHNIIILIMTRWRYDDIASFLLNDLSHENWEVLNLPALAEEDDPLGRELGESLWPEKFPVERLHQTRKTLPSQQWNALYQQRPVPQKGEMIQLDWFSRYDMKMINKLKTMSMERKVIPESFKFFDSICLSIDTAFKEKEMNDPSAITAWGCGKKNQYLLFTITKKVIFPDLVRLVEKIWKEFVAWNMGSVPVLIEDAASGQSLIQELRRKTNIPIVPRRPDKSKVIRLERVSAHIESGQVWLPERALWLGMVEEQIATFPLGKNDDIVDTISQFLSWKFVKPLRRTKFRGYIR